MMEYRIYAGTYEMCIRDSVRSDAQDEGAGGSDVHAARAEVGALIQFAVKHQVGYGYHVVKGKGGRVNGGGRCV